jgi:NADH dehydrogenase [ubiquinone] 1 alpha subcomplex assembly factor 1
MRESNGSASGSSMGSRANLREQTVSNRTAPSTLIVTAVAVIISVFTMFSVERVGPSASAASITFEPFSSIKQAVLTTNRTPAPAPKRLVEFDAAEAPWMVVNDGVMGGVSTSRVSMAKGIATFTGVVSLENNGGFASVRSAPSIGAFANDTKAFQLRVKGDGKVYQFTVDTEAGWFWFAFKPAKAKWSTVTIPHASLVPVTRFGEPTERARFDGKQQTTRLGILISNKRAEKFAISLDWIGVSP